MYSKKYISSKKELYNPLIRFIVSKDKNDSEKFFQEIINIIQKQKILEDIDESILLLRLISTISTNHHRAPNFFDSIIQIIQFITENIKPSITSTELFNIFKYDKLLLFYLFKTNIIEINDTIVNTIVQQNVILKGNYLHFFFPQIRNLLEINLAQDIESQLFESSYNLSDFESICKQGENDSFLCKLIRNDDIHEFAKYMTMNNTSYSSKINSSLFETNRFLIDNNPTLIEYSAFVGSIQIFKFLQLNHAELNESLWLYAIHGKNVEIINLLEELSVKPIEMTYKDIFEEAIKCHHNEIAEYIYNNLMNCSSGFEKECLSMYFAYYNFDFIPDECDDQLIIDCACAHNYITLFKMHYENNRNKNCFASRYLRIAANNNNIDIIDFLFAKPENKIYRSTFKNCSLLTKLTVPASTKIIGKSAFEGCSSLEHIELHSYIIMLGSKAFKGCTSLVSIDIPSCVTEFGSYCFDGCTKLSKIDIPCSVKTINKFCFRRCESLTEISLPPSIEVINISTFCSCAHLVKVVLPQSLKIIDKSAFNSCFNLSDIALPGNLTVIGPSAFLNCFSIGKMKLPPSVKFVGYYAFYGCQMELIMKKNIMVFKGSSLQKEIRPMSFYTQTMFDQIIGHYNTIYY